MNKKLGIVMGILSLGFALYLLGPHLLREHIFEMLDTPHYYRATVLRILSPVALLMLFFGIRKMILYARSVGKSIKSKVAATVYTGFFLVMIPGIVNYVNNFVEILEYVEPFLAFLNKTMIHVFGSLVFFIWGLILAWKNRGLMQERPVFFSKEMILRFVRSINFWVFIVFLIGIFAGYFYIQNDVSGQEAPEGSIFTITEPGYLFDDPRFSYKTDFKVEAGDTITNIHQIKQRRMLVSMADGGHGWYTINHIHSDQGWKGYLFSGTGIHSLRVAPDHESGQITEAGREGFQRRYPKNTEVRILDTQRPEEKYSIWYRIAIHDSRADREVTGWVSEHFVRINGQMHNRASSWLWTPLNWINMKLGSDFFAGLVHTILIAFFFPLIVFSIIRALSIMIRSMSNDTMILILIIFSIGVFIRHYFSFFDASAYNWNNWMNVAGNALYVLLVGGGAIYTLSKFIRICEERRCDACRYWYGYVYSRMLLSRNKDKYKFTTTTHYSDGSSRVTGVRYKTVIKEDWEDFCECGGCGHRWTLKRHERKES